MPLINYWLLIDMMMIVFKYPYKSIGKRLMQYKITDRNLSTL